MGTTIPVWRRRMGEAFRLWNTPAELAGYRNGINLFFGALLGANLGTMGDVPIVDYVALTGLLASVVIAIQVVSNTHSRLYALVTAAGLSAALLGLRALGKLQFVGVSENEGRQIIATVIIWVVTVLFIKFIPVRGNAAADLAAIDPDG